MIIAGEDAAPDPRERALALIGEDEHLVFADGFDEALIGVARLHGGLPVAVYDRSRCLEMLTEEIGDYGDAVEHFEFNVAGSWIGEQTPLYLELLP